MYTVQLEVFEGPMELLLHLVEKNELDIYTVSIAAITDQFIDFIEHSSSIDLENIGEFMVMASLLMRIKVRQLLPISSKLVDDDENLVDEEQALVERLIEYRMFKEVSLYLGDRLEGKVARVYYRPYEDDREAAVTYDWAASLKQLIKAFIGLEKEVEPEKPCWDLIPRSDVDVDQMMNWLLNRLGSGCDFRDLWQQFSGRRERVALFLGLLELIHMGLISASQEAHSGVIILSRNEVAVC
ncbi:MAG: segregation and condensation protein A [Methylocystaceae bacterium]